VEEQNQRLVIRREVSRSSFGSRFDDDVSHNQKGCGSGSRVQERGRADIFPDKIHHLRTPRESRMVLVEKKETGQSSETWQGRIKGGFGKESIRSGNARASRKSKIQTGGHTQKEKEGGIRSG